MDRKDSATPFKNFEYRYINQPLLNNLVIMDLGHERCPATKPQIGPEHRNHVSLHLVTSGKGILVIDQKTFRVGPGQIFITPCDTVCCYFPDREDAWEYFWITFKGSKCVLLCEMMGLTKEKPVYSPLNTEAIYRAFSELISLEKNYRYAINFFAFSKLFMIVCLINEERKISPELTVDQRETCIQNIIGYIERNYSNREVLSLEAIANWIHLSPIYLNRLFKKFTGSSVHQYIINYRLSKAGELIAHSGLSFLQIAQITGWNDYVQFSKVFKKYYGVSPSHFKKSQREDGPLPSFLRMSKNM